MCSIVWRRLVFLLDVNYYTFCGSIFRGGLLWFLYLWISMPSLSVLCRGVSLFFLCYLSITMNSMSVLCWSLLLTFLYYLWFTIPFVELLCRRVSRRFLIICEVLRHLWQYCVNASLYFLCYLWISMTFESLLCCLSDLSLLSVNCYAFCGNIM